MQPIPHQLRLLVGGFLIFACAQRVSGATWKFLVYGDSRGTNSSNAINTPILSELATQTVAENPVFVLFVGDFAYSGSLANYVTWTNTMHSVYAAGIPICAIAGNHESADFGDFKSIFVTPFTTTPFAGMTNVVVDNSSFDGRSYSFNFKNAMFLCMDNYSNSSTSAHCVNQPFLDARLAARNPTTTPLVFAMWHEPAFRAGQDNGLEAKAAQRNTAWTSLQNAGCRQVFNGHDHAYAAARADEGDGNPNNDTYQVVVGTAGAPLYTVSYSGDTGSWTVVPISSESQYGYLRVVVDDVAQTVSQTWVHRTGVNTYADTSSAVTYTYGPTWINSAASGNWSGAGNWNTGALPFNGAAVTFGAGGSTSVVDSVSRTVDTIILNRTANFVISSSGGAGLTINRGVTVTNTYTYTIAAPVTLGRPNTWAVTASGALQVSGIVSGTNSLTKTGSGTLTLSGANTYSGNTTVSNGYLSVTGSLGTGAVSVASGASLTGNGVIDGPVTIANGATLVPTGTLTINSNLTISSSAFLNYDFGTASDQIAVTGNLQLGGTLNISDNGGFGIGTYTLFTYTGALTNNGLTIGTKPDESLVYQIDTSIAGQVRLIVLTPFAAWQMQYFGCTNGSTAAADADPDGDNLSNEAEFISGTNPTNSASALQVIAITREGDDIRVAWSTAGGHTNQLEYLLTLGSANDYQATNQLWADAASAVIVPGSGDVITNAVDVGGVTNAPSRYYRVRLVP